MCVLAILLGPSPRTSLIVAANRDEAYARPSLAPHELEPGILAGQDGESGGTWLGVRSSELFVAITNREAPPKPPDALSRGLLALEALRCRRLT